MDDEWKMDAAAQRFAELKGALDKTPLWGQLEHAARERDRQIAGGIQEVLDDLAYLCTRDDGWLRVTNRDGGSRVYFEFKFTSSRWPNHYVYYETDGPRMGEGLDGLRRKYEQVARGERKPTRDRAYDHPDR